MSAVATPPAMFAPARLWTSRTPPRPRIEATIAAVVVFPFVALMIELPPGRRADSSPIACGSMRSSSRPGSDVPPRPARRDSTPTPRAAATLSPSRRHGARTRRALGTARIVAGVIPTGSPSA